jgi:hypothetical protein
MKNTTAATQNGKHLARPEIHTDQLDQSAGSPREGGGVKLGLISKPARFRHSGRGFTGRSGQEPREVSPRRTNFNKRLPAAALRYALLDACWDASVLYRATTVAVFLTYILDHVRQRPDFDALGLGRLVDWLVGLRARQPDDATLFVGRGAVNRIIDAVVDAFDASDLEAQLAGAAED